MTVRGYRAADTYPVDRLGCYVTGNPENYPVWDNPEYNALYEKAMRAKDFDEFQDLVIQASNLWTASHLDVGVPEPSYFIFYQPWLRGRENGYVYNGGSNFFGAYASYWIDGSKK
jgi:ABC-type transport system substrate-binding protein